MRKLLLFVLALSFVVCANAQLICVDPGHGGSDPGACGCGLQEAAINLDTCARLTTALKNRGFSVCNTRTTNTTVSLSGRTSYANSKGAARFVSVHCNAFNGSAHGTETFCYGGGSSTSFSMRNAVNPKVVAALGTRDRGCKTADFYVVKYTNMPAILVELAFIDNPSDSAKLGNANYRQAAANAIANGVDVVTLAMDEEFAESNEYMAPTWSSNGTSLFVRQIGSNNIREVVLESEVSYAVNSRETVETDVKVWEENDVIYVSDTQGKRVLVDKGVVFNPILSPDETKVIYSELGFGLHVCDLQG
ncbi:MAG TPA: N-acetylmuramoyl-L-alanine amidase, partial [Planctomycetota bacterium]|nr:N-acetylmuramoyl-L-alanine amidase [Planctomycetota bacterium]